MEQNGRVDSNKGGLRGPVRSCTAWSSMSGRTSTRAACGGPSGAALPTYGPWGALLHRPSPPPPPPGPRSPHLHNACIQGASFWIKGDSISVGVITALNPFV